MRLLIKVCLRGFLNYFAYQPSVLIELQFCRRVVVIMYYRFYFYMPTLHQLVSEQGQVPTMAQKGVRVGKPVVVDDKYECDEVSCDAQLEMFFQQMEEWFDTLSKQLAP